ncbi:MAG: UDP-3-O-(3-hydroxymyristoyl)glucosamine N-acyltransferase [Hyphomonadaceae bacterium]|nr:UDP-3-O-(3-hydroxymyristoyl)glucosamine N-acyltransferase [Hyphomonadaceae bacterium]
MIDARFYETLGPLSVRELADGLHAEGDLDRLISSAAPFERAGPNDLCFYEGALPKDQLETTAGVCLMRAEIAPMAKRAGAIVVAQAPRVAFGRMALRLFRPRSFAAGVAVHPEARLEAGVELGAGAVIGARAQIGAETRIGPNAVIGPGVTIGRRSKIGANCTIGFALIGDDVTVLAGAVIGEAGFGVAGDAGGLHDVPHLGRVIVQDRVTIGANSTIDRGVFDDTILAEEAKIDNLCQIAHNVTIGRRTMMAAFAGVSGSTRIGDDVRMGGRVGVSDHRSVGEGAALAGGSAVLQDVPAGETWGGYPAKPVRAWMREIAWLKSKAAGKS